MAVDRIGTGRFQHQILFAAGTCFMADSMEIMLLSFLTIVLKAEWDWGDEDENYVDTKLAGLTSLMFAGALVGTSILGPLGDRVGRRPILFCAAFIISFFGLATAFCTKFSSLLFVRFMVGFGIGGLTVPFDILAEFLPTENRGRYLLLIEYFWTLGSMLVPIIAYYSIEIADSWRLFVAICAIPCIGSFIAGMYFVPESPRWLILKGKHQEALEILRHAAITNGKDVLTLFPENCEICCGEVTGQESNVKDLFQPKWRNITLLLFAVWCGFSICYYGAIMATTKVFGEEDGGNGEGPTFDYVAIFIASSAEIVGTAIVIALVDRVGRVPIQAASYCCGGISMFLLCVFLDKWGRAESIGLAFVARVCEMAGSCVTWVSTAEIFSTDIRSTGHAATNAVSRLGGFMIPYVVTGSSFKTIGIVMLIANLVTAFCASLLPETKGKQLDQTTRQESGSSSPVASEGTELI